MLAKSPSTPTSRCSATISPGWAGQALRISFAPPIPTERNFRLRQSLAEFGKHGLHIGSGFGARRCRFGEAAFGQQTGDLGTQVRGFLCLPGTLRMQPTTHCEAAPREAGDSRPFDLTAA
ncbi:MAG: hypothetical protein WEB60_03250 [Terrimicrobiaceae bacterium]